MRLVVREGEAGNVRCQSLPAKVQGKTKPLLNGILATCPYPAAPVVLLGQLGRRKDLAKICRRALGAQLGHPSPCRQGSPRPAG